MSDKLTSRSKFQPLFPGDRATAPSALELDNPSAWALFDQGQRRGETEFQETVASTHAATLPAHLEDTLAQTLPDGLRVAAAARPGGVTVDDVLVLARRRNRASPRAEAWAGLVAAMARVPVAAGLPPVPPPLGGASSAMQKRLRLRDQAEWADVAGPAALRAMHDVLEALPEEHWLHFDES